MQTDLDERPGVSPRIARPELVSRLVRLVIHGVTDDPRPSTTRPWNETPRGRPSRAVLTRDQLVGTLVGHVQCCPDVAPSTPRSRSSFAGHRVGEGHDVAGVAGVRIQDGDQGGHTRGHDQDAEPLGASEVAVEDAGRG